MNSGRIYVTESQIICGSRDGTANVLYPHSTYTHPSTIQCSAATEINNLKSSVSSGKTQVANAITGKGVSASQNDTFATLASKINQITTGSWYRSFNTNAAYADGSISSYTLNLTSYNYIAITTYRGSNKAHFRISVIKDGSIGELLEVGSISDYNRAMYLSGNSIMFGPGHYTSYCWLHLFTFDR